MHAIKGGWVGQTFALAKSNESEGRKSRIRRSKEERKAMVEFFIKKYQKLNNGNFPSLNLTHKDVGGSFYTVREIVRDIIQENRVLGPAKLIQEKQSSNLLEEEPLGSIALEPNYSLTISNESRLVTNEHQGGSEEPNLVSDGQPATDRQQIFEKGKVINVIVIDEKNKGLGQPNDGERQAELVEVEQNAVNKSVEAGVVSDRHHGSPELETVFEGLVINSSQVDVGNKESDELTKTEQRSEPSEADNAEEESAASRSKVMPIAENIIVETFPLSPVTRTSKMDGSLSDEVKEITSTSTEQGSNKVESAASDGNSQAERTNSSETALAKHEDPVLGSSNYPCDAGEHEIQDFTNRTVKASSTDVLSVNFEQSQEAAGAKDIYSPNGNKAKFIGKSGSTSGHSKSVKELIENQVGVQHDGNPQKASNATLDRINLESWEGASKESAKPNDNPLWAAFKAFIDAFIKYWFE